ncbi:hypothetical protein E2F48_00280 [Arthrobacter crusticola]|uniref:DUF8094 domain-containing protein n=1 Tax=Arthrobacter crusticola TaxID=2547960 RepID=A0A4R5U214_9MICC|nr:hypothetical protein [Arthrobacter crusticola]TDK27618.1 hypothetical protein E2F48_00280 [Arthrobacter crusticola]
MKTAVSIIIAGVLLMLIGIGQRTFWAPPETVTFSVPAGAETGPVTVIDAAARNNDAGDVDIAVKSGGAFTLAVGRAADVDAWVGDAAHLRVTGVGDEELKTEFTDGEATVPDPRGADLWTSEETAEGSVTHSWINPAEGDFSILLVSDGTAAAPSDISITEPNDASTPLAVPLIVAGALLAVLGIALLFVAPRSTGSGRGRSTPAPEGSRAYLRQQRAGADRGARARRMVHPVAVAAAALLAGTAVAGPAAAQPAIQQQTKPAEGGSGEGRPGAPAVLEPQLERILDSVATTVAEADAAADSKLLQPRTAGAALELRTAGYAVRAKDKKASAPAPVAGSPVLTRIVPAAGEWPRTVLALTKGEGNPVPQALVLTQDSPRTNYKLVSAIQMLPGTTFPASAADGALKELAPDAADGLAMAPQAAVAAIADFLTSPKGKHNGTFEANSFADAITGFQSGVVADRNNAAATISFRHVAQAPNTRALGTEDGGAVVFGYLKHTYSSVPKGRGDSIDLNGTIYETLTGREKTEKGIDVNYGEAVMMYVPPAGSKDKIRVIGAAQQLLAAKLK